LSLSPGLELFRERDKLKLIGQKLDDPMDELIAQVHHDEPPPHLDKASGWIEVIAGSMFSGKSEELIRRLRRAKIARQRVQVFKPEIDKRFSNDHIVSHSEIRHESSNVSSVEELVAQVRPDTEVVGIDEAQFFGNDLIEVANQLARNGMRVIIAGLDQDYTGKPWEPMPQLLAIAEYITKTHAICMRCGQPANYSQRTFESEERVAVGASDKYEARCRRCFVPHADAPTIHHD
jgi:thymidine kinase